MSRPSAATFPFSGSTVHGKPLVYLDNAATTQKPQAVIDRSVPYYREENANMHRGVHTLSGRATDAYRGGAHDAAALPERGQRRRSSSSAAPPKPSISWRRPTAAEHVGAGDEVLITDDGAPLQHRAVADALRGEGRAAARRPDQRRGRAAISTSTNACSTTATRLVAVAHVSNALGTSIRSPR